MNPSPLTAIIVNPYYPLAETPDRFSRIMQATAGDTQHRFEHSWQDEPVAATGTSSRAVMYALGHLDRLQSATTLTPAMLRAVRDCAYGLRLSGGQLHIFGVLDLDSPYGSRRLLESLLRQMKELEIPTVVHIGVWHPTPREFTLGLEELTTLMDDRLVLGSVFPIDMIIKPDLAAAKKYIDGIRASHHHSSQPSNHQPNHETPTLPLHSPCFMADATLQDEDILLVANHSLHSLDPLAQAIQQELGKKLLALPATHPTNPKLVDDLNKQHHVMSLSNTTSGEEAYFGTELQHPYFERIYHDSAVDLLEMLLSPHFGYHAAPAQTVVIVDEPSHPQFDALLSHHLKALKQKQQHYYCCLIDPTDVRGSLFLTNLNFDSQLPLHPQLHAYG